MIQIAQFSYSPFSENTYVLSDESNECIIIDPGCYYEYEREELRSYIVDSGLKPVILLLTHAHIDHIFGCAFVEQQFGLRAVCHRNSVPLMENVVQYGAMFGVKAEACPPPLRFIEEGDEIQFGNSKLQSFYTPGHSLDSMSFYCPEQHFLISGDVLFKESIGRTDLPGGDADVLFRSIREKLFILPGNTTVYSGHGPETSIDYEKKFNPFVGQAAMG